MYKPKMNPMDERKQDSSKNADGLDAVIARQKAIESTCTVVRVSRNTWIVVPKHKNNKEYIERYKQEKLNHKL